MSNVFKTLGPLMLLCVVARAQSAPAAPQFEAADVHVSPAGASQSGAFLPGGRIEFRATTLLSLIATAYSVPANRVAGGPSWIDTDRFDVIAKAASGASQIGLRNMLQGLLAERFGLTVKNEEKPLEVFALMPLKSGVAKRSDGKGDPDCKTRVEEGVRVIDCHNVTMASLAERLPLMANGYFSKPVVDRTGFKDAYDFTLQFLPRGQLPPGSEGAAMSLFTSIEKQLGVKVENQTAPVPMISIDKVNRTPAPNPPDTIAKLGATPTEFEVVDIHPSRPDQQEDFDMKNGRIVAKGIALKDLITFAYNVEDDWVRGEKWLETERFDIVAKTAPTESDDTLRVMVQSMLADRFKLKAHREPQPVTVYALTVVKSKLKEADPTSRSTCRQSAADGARVYTCQNTTMAQLAEKIRQPAGGYLEHPVVDLTGLKGAYDFTVSWTPANRIFGGGRRGGGDAADASAAPVASDRPVGFTIFESFEKQLGLKLATQKHPMPVVVVDSMNRTPTEN